MARFDTSGLDDVLREMEEMGQSAGRVADAMIMTGASETRVAWKKVASQHGYHDSGEMINSIGYRHTPRTVGTARAVDVYPQGVDTTRNVRNAEKAFYLHYGTSKIQGSHWVDEAEALAEKNAVPAMKKVWDQFIQTGQVPEVDIQSDQEEVTATSKPRKQRKKKSWLDEHFEKALHRWY